MAYLSDIEIAQQCEMKPIMEIAKKAHVDEKYVDENGAYDYGAMDLVSFSHGKYYRMRPEALGFFGYSIMKPKTAKRRAAEAGKGSTRTGRSGRKNSRSKGGKSGRK
jgi:hypothetical protein